MTEQYREFIAAGVQILAVVHDSEETARDYVQRHKIPFPCLVDAAHEVYDLYQVERKAISLGQRPGLFVIDRDGLVRFAYVGWQQWEIPRDGEILELCRGIPCGAGLE